jgi:hypothetical protein
VNEKIWIVPTRYETEAKRRRNRAKNDRQINQGAPLDRLDEVDLLGAFGEDAVSEYSGLPWSGCGQNGKGKGPDVGVDVQVRTSRAGSQYLWITKDDPPEARYVFVTKHENKACIHGWRWGCDVKENPEYFGPLPNGKGDGRKQFWVPLQDLVPMRYFRKDLWVTPAQTLSKEQLARLLPNN